jgi:Ca2+-transporting ATPase
MGAWRIARARVLTRRASSIETLGSATVLCTDKTGTLTENRMTVAQLRRSDGDVLRFDHLDRAIIPGRSEELVVHGLLASAPEPFDPMEKAFHCKFDDQGHRRQPAAPAAGGRSTATARCRTPCVK